MPDGKRHSSLTDDGIEKPEVNAHEIVQAGGEEVNLLIEDMERELEAGGGLKKGFFQVQFANPKHFTWLLVAFASMGGLLSGLDQSLISGANLYLPEDLGLSERQNSLVNAGMPLGAVGGAEAVAVLRDHHFRAGADQRNEDRRTEGLKIVVVDLVGKAAIARGIRPRHAADL